MRVIKDATDPTKTILVDIYEVLDAYEVTCPRIAHAIKKLLCPGNRGKGDILQDLIGAKAALNRAIDKFSGLHAKIMNIYTPEELSMMANKVHSKVLEDCQKQMIHPSFREKEAINELPLPINSPGFSFKSQPMPRFIEESFLPKPKDLKITKENIEQTKKDIEEQKNRRIEELNKQILNTEIYNIPKEESDPKEHE